jgi:hypothetical protein
VSTGILGADEALLALIVVKFIIGKPEKVDSALSHFVINYIITTSTHLLIDTPN